MIKAQNIMQSTLSEQIPATLDRYTPERIYQPEGALPTTEDVAYEQRVRASDGNNTQP